MTVATLITSVASLSTSVRAPVWIRPPPPSVIGPFAMEIGAFVVVTVAGCKSTMGRRRSSVEQRVQTDRVVPCRNPGVRCDRCEWGRVVAGGCVSSQSVGSTSGIDTSARLCDMSTVEKVRLWDTAWRVVIINGNDDDVRVLEAEMISATTIRGRNARDTLADFAPDAVQCSDRTVPRWGQRLRLPVIHTPSIDGHVTANLRALSLAADA